MVQTVNIRRVNAAGYVLIRVVDDAERLSLVEKTTSGKWIVDESVHVRQVKDDVVEFDLHSPLHRSSPLDSKDVVDAAASDDDTRASNHFCRAMLCKRGLCCHAVSV